ncbi:MAG: hypothetical protein H7839_21165, partial [Magnetococcus sp. YQC-5]
VAGGRTIHRIFGRHETVTRCAAFGRWVALACVMRQGRGGGRGVGGGGVWHVGGDMKWQA